MLSKWVTKLIAEKVAAELPPLLRRVPSKADFEWLNHAFEEQRRTIDDLKNQMRARETFDWEVETRLAKLEKSR